MRNKDYEILGNVANYLNEMAISHRLISASTASAFTYMAREEVSLEKLQTIIILILKIKEENEEIVLTPFYEIIVNLKVVDVGNILKSMLKAIENPVHLDGKSRVVIPSVQKFVQIGRSAKPEHGNHIVFTEDKTLSRIHMVVTVDEGEFFIEDRSANGTFINGEKIEKGVKTPVSMDDEIRIGRAGSLVSLEHAKILELLS